MVKLDYYETIEQAIMCFSKEAWEGFERTMRSEKVPDNLSGMRDAYVKMLNLAQRAGDCGRSPYPALGAAFALKRIASRRDSEIAGYWFLDLIGIVEQHSTDWPEPSRDGSLVNLKAYNRYNGMVYAIMGHPVCWLIKARLYRSEDGREIKRAKTEDLFEILRNIVTQYKGARTDSVRLECMGTAYYVWSTVKKREEWQELDVECRKILWPMVRDLHARLAKMKHTPWYKSAKIQKLMDKKLGHL